MGIRLSTIILSRASQTLLPHPLLAHAQAMGLGERVWTNCIDRRFCSHYAKKIVVDMRSKTSSYITVSVRAEFSCTLQQLCERAHTMNKSCARYFLSKLCRQMPSPGRVGSYEIGDCAEQLRILSWTSRPFTRSKGLACETKYLVVN